MKSIIIQTSPVLAPFRTFKEWCEFNKLPYHTLKKQKSPYTYNGFTAERLTFVNAKCDEIHLLNVETDVN